MINNSILIFHGDNRQDYLADYLTSKGYIVFRFSTLPSTPNEVPITSYVVGPLSFSPADYKIIESMRPNQVLFGGNFQKDFILSCEAKNIPLYDFMKSELLIEENAKITAECFIGTILMSTPTTLYNAKILICGYGRCGSKIASYLLGFHSEVYILETISTKRNLAQRCGCKTVSCPNLENLLPNLSFLINTVPQPVLTKEQLKLLPNNCHLFELASAPGGFLQEELSDLSFSYHPCPGLPGKIAPKTAGIAIGKEICRYLERMDRNGL